MSQHAIFVLALAILSGLLVTGCSPGTDAAVASPSAATPASAGSAAVPAFRNAEGQLVCPVMKTVIASEKEAVGFADHDGKRYYFCCGMCPDKFKADPHAYVSHS